MKPLACGQTVLPGRAIFSENIKCDILSHFQTMCATAQWKERYQEKTFLFCHTKSHPTPKKTKSWVNDKLEIRLHTEKYFRNISRDHLDMIWLIALTFQKVLERKNISISNYSVFALNVLFGFSKVFQPLDVVLSKSKWKIVENPCRWSKILLQWKFQIDFQNLTLK